MAASADLVIPNILQAYGGGLGYIINAPVGASEVIYRGTFVSSDAGYAAPLAASEVFWGIALEGVTGGTSDGDESVKLYVGGVFQHAVTGGSADDIGKAVYASADNTLTMTAAGNSAIGRCAMHVTGTTLIIHMKKPGETLTEAAA